MRENSFHGNREIPQAPSEDGTKGRQGKARGNTPSMYACGKSDGCIGPEKLPNKGREDRLAEAVEERRPTEGNTYETTAPRT